MKILSFYFFLPILISMHPIFANYSVSDKILFNSKFLNRNVDYRLVSDNKKVEKVFFMNDGQDLENLDLLKTINNLKLEGILFVCVHANQERLREYGTAISADYKNRGDLAQNHTNFIVEELLPKILNQFNLKNKARNQYFLGFSLGGLSAMDIVINNPTIFSKVGVFSGSLWWRKKAYEDGYDDENDRIMHVQVRNMKSLNNQKFWFQCGTKDEDSDRNGNGIIDSIDDTQDIIMEICKKGYVLNQNVYYEEVLDGEHNPKTWGEVMPKFLKWALEIKE